ncbi:MAG: hypothetical protein AAGB19_02490 [Cyanobacteria bacterium P01_F01_bin.3]
MRAACAAIQESLMSAGVPADYILMPYRDDPKQLLRRDNTIIWLDQSYRGGFGKKLGEVFFNNCLERGEVIGGSIFNVLTPECPLHPEDLQLGSSVYGAFHLPFNIEHIIASSLEDWITLPVKPKPKPLRPARSFRVKRALSRRPGQGRLS